MFDNPLILQAIQEVFNERFDDEMKELESEEPHIFSEKHNKKMAKLIKDQKKPYFTLICTAGRRAACIVAAILILSASALSVKAIREAVFDFIMRIFSDHTVVTTESGTDTGYPETIEEEYYISELPEGFYQTQYVLNNTLLSSCYSDDHGNYILFKQEVKSLYETYYDINNSMNRKAYIYKDMEYMIIETDVDTTYIWDNGHYVFEITGNIDKKELLDLCYSTKSK